MRLLLLVKALFVLFSFQIFAQTYGPNDPSQQANLGAGNPWSGAGGVFTSDNSYSTVSTAGLSSNLRANNYGFNLILGDVVTGIQLDVERRADLGADISLIQPWADGELSVINNYNLPAGNNRMMIVFVGVENGSEPIINNVTFAGQSMIKATGFSYNTSFWARLECWYLLESSLTSIPLGAHNVEVTYDPVVKLRFFDILSTAVFDNVDQTNPFLSFEQKGQNGGPANSQLNTPIAAQVGGMYLTGIFSGNNTNPDSANGATNTFQINSGFIEGTDVYRESYMPGGGATGGCLQTAYKIPAVSGTENPIFTFNGNPNRRLMIGIGLRKIGVLDTYVQLQKAGVTVGNNYAQTGVAWPLTDTYFSYGGPANLWGTSWSQADINDPLFGSLIRVNVINGSALIDHKRITVYVVNILPVELVDFFAHRIDERKVKCSWITATENNNSHFSVQRSFDGIFFEEVGTVKGAGNSTNLQTYEFTDLNSSTKTAYYRLKQVDFDGEFVFSDVRAVDGSADFQSLVYPNPVENWASITACTNCESISIVNSKGQVIDFQEGLAFDDGYTFNLSAQSDGVYFMVIVKKTGKSSVQRLVKQSK